MACDECSFYDEVCLACEQPIKRDAEGCIIKEAKE